MEDIRHRIREMMSQGKDDAEGGLGLAEADGEVGSLEEGRASAPRSPSTRSTHLPSQEHQQHTQRSTSTQPPPTQTQTHLDSASRSMSLAHLNPLAEAFRPNGTISPSPHRQIQGTPDIDGPGTRKRRREEPEDGEDVEDVEMGEVSEAEEGEGEDYDITVSPALSMPIPQVRVTNPSLALLHRREDRSPSTSRRSSPALSTSTPTNGAQAQVQTQSSRLRQLVASDSHDEPEEGEASDEEEVPVLTPVTQSALLQVGGGGMGVDDDASSELTSLSDL